MFYYKYRIILTLNLTYAKLNIINGNYEIAFQDNVTSSLQLGFYLSTNSITDKTTDKQGTK